MSAAFNNLWSICGLGSDVSLISMAHRSEPKSSTRSISWPSDVRKKYGWARLPSAATVDSVCSMTKPSQLAPIHVAVQLLEIFHTQKCVQNPTVAPEDPRSSDEALADVDEIRGQPADQECSLEIVDVPLHRLVIECQCRPQLRGVEGLTMAGGEHVQETTREL